MMRKMNLKKKNKISTNCYISPTSERDSSKIPLNGHLMGEKWQLMGFRDSKMAIN